MNAAMMRRRTFLSAVKATCITLAFALILGACSPSPQFLNQNVTGSAYATQVELKNASGGAVQLNAPTPNQVTALFFGFTQCPDVCPTSMQELAEVKQMLGKDGDRLQGIFVTVDPERDTPEVLKAYMTNFDPTFLALRGTPEQLAVVAKDFKIYYKKVDGKTPTSYSLDHSAGSYVYDPVGRLRVYSRYGSGAQALAADIKILLNEAG